MRIDAHQHFWRVERGDYGWLTPAQGVLYRDYMPEDLLPELRSFGISRCVAVQAAPTVAETEFLLDLAEKHDWIAGVVGWLDLDSDACLGDYERLRRCAKFVGVRPMIQDLDVRWLLRPRVLRHLRALADDGFPVDLQARPRYLPVLKEVLTRVEGLRAVIDHAAKPFIAEGTLDPWREQMAELARFESLYCKLSGLITEGKQGAWTHADFAPYVRHVAAVFGVERVMFGSDWPVCLISGSYAQVWDVLRHALPELAADGAEHVYGRSAAAFYRL